MVVDILVGQVMAKWLREFFWKVDKTVEFGVSGFEPRLFWHSHLLYPHITSHNLSSPEVLHHIPELNVCPQCPFRPSTQSHFNWQWHNVIRKSSPEAAITNTRHLCRPSRRSIISKTLKLHTVEITSQIINTGYVLEEGILNELPHHRTEERHVSLKYVSQTQTSPCSLV